MTTLAEDLLADNLINNVRRSLNLASQYAFHEVQEDGSWCGELKSNASITAEYITLLYAIGLSIPDPDLWISWLLSEQHIDGSWALAPEIPGDISVTVETYLALRILGLDREHPALRKAKGFALSSGGVARVGISTRILLATFGLFPWTAIPELPAELILMPPSNPFSVCQMASWARGTLIPLLIVRHHRPVFALPNGQSDENTFIDELWCDPSHKQVSYAPSLWKPWKTGLISYIFTAADKILHALNGMRGFSWRARARQACVSWILENLDQRSWGNTFSPMHTGILALFLEGYTPDSPPVCRGIEALQTLVWHDQAGKRVQPAISPVRDTVFMTIALCDAASQLENKKGLGQSIDWIKTQQQLQPAREDKTADSSPNLREGGFSFGVSTKCPPDVGDTSTAIVAMVKQNPHAVSSCTVLLALRWILGMQNRDGGWGAFDHENHRLFLNKTTFSDMNMCDPSTADVTGRVLESFGYILRSKHAEMEVDDEKYPTLPSELYELMTTAAKRAAKYLLSQQDQRGCWYGRWGANYIYGTSVVLSGLAHFRSSPSSTAGLCCIPCKRDDPIQKAITAGTDWLVSVQNKDGGWGETLLTYRESKLAGQGIASTPSQTAWALMGLLTSLPPSHPSVFRGVQYLIMTQKNLGVAGASWQGRMYTGTALPNRLYVGYSLYSHYFPMMALGRYAHLVGRESPEEGDLV